MTVNEDRSFERPQLHEKNHSRALLFGLDRRRTMDTQKPTGDIPEVFQKLDYASFGSARTSSGVCLAGTHSIAYKSRRRC
ncbi:hypothetical protein BC936DRAFT_139119 [Jimgerdemannia flammicorona]|uniref:Uncharacterized protein n=1 Tax=Jimgerdemannia flammicorona TaxID=994334 RepID=A0A433DHU2_9FUNG|nr:hypothetical protein BC936DRAFT_139119 [Jimgerdemannia flammicorona]